MPAHPTTPHGRDGANTTDLLVSPDVVAFIRDAVIASLLDRIYHEPVGMEHETDAKLLLHTDIPQFTEQELADHRARLRLRLFIDGRMSPWLRERVALLQGVSDGG